MKQFATVAFAAFVGVLAALILYYVLVTKPGVENELARVAQVRAEARTVARDLDAAAAGSIARAREGFEGLATEQLWRSRVSSALVASQAFKVALTESFMARGEWPATAAEAGLGAPEDYASDGLHSIVLEAGGVIRVQLADSLAAGSAVRLLPTVNKDSWQIAWRCEVEGDVSLLQALPHCTSAGTVASDSMTQPDAGPTAQLAPPPA